MDYEKLFQACLELVKGNTDEAQQVYLHVLEARGL